MGLSAANWMAMGAIIWLLLGSEINYFLVLGVLLVSSIAGVIIHIPAGIGVLEAVFIAMLSGEDISKGAIIAALLAWRALYYFLPLLLATVAYLLLESRAKSYGKRTSASWPANETAGPRCARAYGCEPVRGSCRPVRRCRHPAIPRVSCLISRPAALRLPGVRRCNPVI
ncbi:hypothetical protein KPZU09_27800 [Klebsiella pneumoniae]|uniref:Inner membrane protein YbhQ n=1 Tax=Klebsiella pneumoniae TaxID=573 RepID=A0A919HVM6_KLEPN|nr:hypothetical protein KPZU09_27800 [Klebsiella pneumoniae]